MRFLSAALLTFALCASAAQAQYASATPITITSNFQVKISVDASAPTADVANALAQVNKSLGGLADRQCNVIAVAFNSHCSVEQLNMGSSVHDNRRQGNNAVSQRFVTGNLTATFALTSQTDAPNTAPAEK
jgi:hypothetical protein